MHEVLGISGTIDAARHIAIAEGEQLPLLIQQRHTCLHIKGLRSGDQSDFQIDAHLHIVAAGQRLIDLAGILLRLRDLQTQITVHIHICAQFQRDSDFSQFPESGKREGQFAL